MTENSIIILEKTRFTLSYILVCLPVFKLQLYFNKEGMYVKKETPTWRNGYNRTKGGF